MHTVFLWLLYFLSAILTQYHYVALLKIFLKPRSSRRIYPLLPTLLLALSIVALSRFIPGSYRIFYNLALYLLIPFAFFKGSVFQRILGFALWFMLSSVTEGIAMVIVNALGWEYGVIDMAKQMRIDFLYTGIVMVLYHFLHGSLRMIEDRLDRHLWLRLIVALLATVGASTVIVINTYSLSEGAQPSILRENISLIDAFGLFLPMIALFGMVSLIHQLNESTRSAEESRLAEQKALAELQQNQMLVQKNTEYRQLRHDFKNHLLAIDALGQKGEYKRQHEYLSSLYNAFEQTQTNSYSGHVLIDCILDTKKQLIEEKGIDFTWNTKPINCKMSISDLHLCALIGNMLDNAIEACEEMKNTGKRTIHIGLSVSEKDFIFQTINSCEDARKASAHMENNRSRHGTKRGTGLKSVRRIVDSYNGELLIAPGGDNKTIQVTVYIPNAE